MKRLALILPIFLLLSCSVQKRHYQKGYFISWNKSSTVKKQKEKPVQKENVPELPAELVLNRPSENKTDLSSDASNSFNFNRVSKKKTRSNAEDSCDVLVYKNGTETRVKIIEINTDRIKYKKCDLPDGPTYVSDKNDLFMVKYSNGTREVFKTQQTINSPQQATPNQSPYRYVKKKTGLATSSVIFGILGFYPAILIGGIAAIIMSLIQLNNIALYPDTYGGERKARAGLILGIVSTVVWICIIGLIILSL